MQIKNLDKIQIFLISLIPLLLISGPFLPDLFFTVSGIFFIFFVLRKKKFFYLRNKYFVIFLIWNVYLIINSILSNFPFNSLESSLFYFRFLLGSFSIFYLLNEFKIFEKFLLIGIYSALSILILDSCLQIITGFNLLNYPLDNRLSSLFGEEKKMGSFIIRILPLFLILNIKFFTNYNIHQKIFFFIIVLFSCFLVILTLERTSIILLFIFIFFLFFILISDLKKLIFSLIFFIIISILSLQNLPTLKNRLINLTFNEMFYNDQFFIISPQYHSHFETAFKMFLDKKLFGHGPKMYRYLCSQEKYQAFFYNKISSCSTHPHNTYLQLLSETGIIGTIPVIFLFFYLAYYLFKINMDKINNKFFASKKNKICFSIIILSILVNLFPISTTGNFFNNWISIMYFLPFGYFIYYDYISKK